MGPLSGETLKLWDVAAKKAVDVPLAHAKAGIEAGALKPLAGAPVPLRMPSGAVQTFAPEALAEGFRQGGAFAPAEETRAAAREEEYAAHPLKAAGAGALKGLGAALGVPTDRVIGTAAPYIDGFKQEQDLYRGHYVSGVGERVLGASEGLAEFNPVAHGAGELAGFVAGAGLTGGGVAGGAGRLGLRGVAAGGALEGAALAEVDLDNELARRGEALTAETFSANGGFSRMLAGGVLGGLTSVGGHLLAEAPGAARRALAGRVGAAAEAGAHGVQALDAFATPYARELDLKARQEFSRLHGALSTDAAPASAAQAEAWAAASHAEPGKRRIILDEGQTAIEAAQQRDPRGYLLAQGKEAFVPIHQDIAGELAGSLERVIDRSPTKVTVETYGPKMKGHAQVLATPGLAPEVEAAARQVIDDTTAPAREVLARRGQAEVALEEAKRAARRANATGVDEATRAELMAAVADAERGMRATEHPLLQDYQLLADHLDGLAKAPPKSNAGWHDALYEMSARFKKYAENGKAASALGGVSPETAQAGLAAEAYFVEARNAVRDMMGDEQLYGALGAWSRDYNPARAAQIAAEKNALKGFATRVEVASGKTHMTTDGNKLRSMAREGIHDNTAGPDSLRREALQEYLDATERVHKLIEERLPISKETRAESEAVREEIDRARKALSDSATTAQAEAELKAAGALGAASSLRSGNAAMLGGLVGGAPGAAVAGGIGALSSRGQRVAHKSLLQKIAKQFDDMAGKNVTAFFKGKAVLGPTASAQFLKGAGGARKVFERSVDAIRQAVADPAALGAKITRALGGVGESAPGVAMQFAQIMMRGVGHLAQHIPAGMDPNLDVVAPQFVKPMYSDSEMRSWARRAAAVNDPMSILRHMAAGAASQEEAEVLAEVYPELHEKIKKDLVEHLAKLTVQPTRAQRIQLSVVFGLPVDLNTTPDILLYLQTPAPGRGGGRRGNAPNGGGLKAPVLKTSQALRLETQKER